MGINALTARRLSDRRRREQITQVLKKTITTPVYYEVYSGIINYRTGVWVRMDPVDITQTLASARDELKWRQKHPTENQNAAYITRRYHHGNQNASQTMESIR